MGASPSTLKKEGSSPAEDYSGLTEEAVIWGE
jgi:hypothetical protein